jgi:predicted short-subunit dehydrogenase-like oxidoreductase (DUF2520 family)
MKPNIAIVGCGKVGTTLAIWLSDIGYTIIGVASKSLASAKQTAELAGIDNFSQENSDIASQADIVFISTPDGVISDVCAEISGKKGFKENAVVLHCSGAHPSTILSAAKDCGASIGSMHPLQSFASISKEKNPFQGIIAAVEGEDKAVERARQIATELGATCYTIRTEAKMLYHASAVVASNYLVTLIGLAFKLIGVAGISDTDAFAVLKPLINGTLGNIEKVGITAALTGPISRGDAKTVQQHLEAMATQSPELIALYQALGTETITIARSAETITDEAAENLRQLLSR